MGCVVKQCCCGCTLKTGSIVIGILEAVGCGLFLVIVILATAFFAALRDNSMDQPDVTQEQLEAFHAAMAALVILMIVLAVNLVAQLVFAILLACGASHENPSLIKPWIICSIVSLILSIILYIVSASIAIGNGETASGVQSLVSCALGSALKIYFIVVVRSYHLELTQPGVIKNFA
ncbi:uncharacterized protein [Anabrus simplex]|uniref:uncharacterized protein n=1 Tax=Anabrus simplex TaxID=316456 RepID=UPI0035A281EE